MMYSKISDDTMDLIIADFCSKDCDPAILQNLFTELCNNNCHHKYIKILSANEKIQPCINDIFKTLVYSGFTEVVKILLECNDAKINVTIDNNYAIRKASSEGHIELVKLLLQYEKVDPTADYNYAIRKASCRGFSEIVELLLQCEKVDPMWGSADIKSAFSETLWRGNITIIKLLLNSGKVDPVADSNYAIREASRYGFTGIVKLLLQCDKVDPTADSNYAIRKASYRGYTEIVKLLL